MGTLSEERAREAHSINGVHPLKNFCVAFQTLDNSWQVLETFQSKTEKIQLGEKLNNIFPVGRKGRKLMLAAIKQCLDGSVVDVATSAGTFRVHGWD